jgi:AGCS family alanine or glycine:cation symporter
VRDTLGSLKNKDKNGISPFSAVMTALGGTVGVGSIVGVGYGIAVGGAGSIFWMWVCSFFGMGLKYAEVRIALNKRERVNGDFIGGAPFRLHGIGYKGLAFLFALCCITASFGTGNITQIGTVSSFLSEEGVPKTVCAGLCFAAVSISVFGGRKRIASLNVFAVPTASALYIAVCVAVLLINIDSLPAVLRTIFENAFGFSALTGGVSGALLSTVIREGFVRSMFSNESGMGSSPLAHASSAEVNPDVQAEWGIFEIFFDSFVVSTLTAFCLISSSTYDPFEMFENTFGAVGKWFFLALVCVFALASVLSWCFYAEIAVDYLCPRSLYAKYIYRAAFALVTLAGAFVTGSLLWEIADILNAFMMFPNLFLIYKCRKEIGRIA